MEPGMSDIAKRKLVVKIKKPDTPESAEPKHRKLNSKEKKSKAYHEALYSQGLRRYQFIWPLKTIERLLEGNEKKANDYVLELIEREIAARESRP
jgi:hypothetical protein